ncbi:Lactamase_B_2 domain-containing protein/Lactamase_B_4 domain-containing protein [Cephalotus follicularis]|uniref:ribonuclease Z n=1 Tax=Cephalotus follicularis TaxID=3775 RepID=A0A1Q3CBS9_CEPFO|nr:Lactamase_B_2 domain-containing protein/Lactamase_B_4 domain-containing protein [Cephalotus follicularis]
MSQITNLRLLFFSPLKPSLSSPLSLLSKPIPYHSLFTTLSYSKRQRTYPRHQRSRNFNRKNNSNSTFKENTSSHDKGLSMEETESTFGYNKRRAEGKDKSDIPKKNLQLKVRRLNPTNTISYVQILGTGMDTQDTSPSVLLFFDKQRFIFNAGEGLQRFCTEYKIKLSKIDHIFLSRVCSETAGGLPGLLLTLAGMGEEGMSVNVWGPSDLKYLVDAMRSFIPHAAMVHTRGFGPAPSFDAAAVSDASKFTDPIVLVDDEVVTISAIILWPRSLDGSAVKPGEMSVIYVCELAEVKGKFDPKKAVALGLRAGPKYSQLQSGKSVKSDYQDIMVNPSDVMGPSVPGPIVFLVDCPTESHVEELLSVASLSSYYADSGKPPESAKTVNCIIHLSPTVVTSTLSYQKWMKKFGSAQHIMAGHEMKNVEIPILKSSARISARLNYLCPQFFPAPGFWPLQHLNYPAADCNASGEGSNPKLCESISAENLLKFTLRPHAHFGLDRSLIPSVITSSEVSDDLLSEIPEIVDAAQHVSQFWHGSMEAKEDMTYLQDNEVMVEEPWLDLNTLPSCLENITRDDMEIVLLGTGSSQPSKYRNVSSIYVNLFSKGSLFLDCGEGTLGQLKRRYGVLGADNAVRNLNCIWISHIHADHHSGLARILALRRDLLKGVPHEPLFVVGPSQLKRFLDAYQRLEDLDMQFLDCRNTTETSWDAFEGNLDTNENHSSPDSPINVNKKNSQNTDSMLFAGGSPMQSYWKRPGGHVDNSAAFPLIKRLKKVLSVAGLEALVSFPVVHCPQAFGVVLKAAERLNSTGKVIPGWKIVYSGDTRPCQELQKASIGATVLIHEATFEDGLMEQAIAKNHSTTKEAIEVGDKVGAYRIILTHFSQRYPKVPVFDEKHMHKTCIAFDMMSINIADLPVLPKILPYIKLLFRNEMIEDDESDDIVGDILSSLSAP